MNINHIPAFKKCYIMQKDDIERFANTLADGFSQYDLFKYICNGKYDYKKMNLFWAVSLALVPDNAICIADSKNVNSVLIYIPPKSKDSSPFSYLKVGGIKMLIISTVWKCLKIILWSQYGLMMYPILRYDFQPFKTPLYDIISRI